VRKFEPDQEVQTCVLITTLALKKKMGLTKIAKHCILSLLCC